MHVILGVLANPKQKLKIVKVHMWRWTMIISGFPSVYDFPDLAALFEGHGPIFRWATPSFIVFNSTSLAFIMPTEPVQGHKDHFAIRQLNQAELDDPMERFTGALLRVNSLHV